MKEISYKIDKVLPKFSDCARCYYTVKLGYNELQESMKNGPF